MRIENLHLEPVEGAVILDQEVLLLADGEVVTKLAEEVGQVDSLHCWTGQRLSES